MEISIDGQKISYLDRGKGRVVVLLHGWSKEMNKEKYIPLINLLEKSFRVVAIDFPGFGKSIKPDRPWSVSDYSDLIRKILIRLKINEYIIIGHSFGGRVAIKLAAGKIPMGLKKMILIDSAGIERKALKVKLMVLLAKLVPTGIKNRLRSFGSNDYRDVLSDEIMRETMKKVVAENLEADMERIKVPTLLVWGEEDRTTPLWQAKIIKKLIVGSELEVVSGGNHGLPYKMPKETAEIIVKYLK